MKPNIMELVVNQDKCIGCGVCQSICPIDILPMKFGKYGTFEPHEVDGCLNKCSLCINICPFIEDNDDEIKISKDLYTDEHKIMFHEQLGHYVETYAAHVTNKEKRLKSSSGGVGNFFLKKLLEDNIVDHIISVTSTDYPEQLFRFDIFKKEEELNKSTGSVYYPTELSEVLEYIKKNDGRYAITALPCYAKAIRLAQKKNVFLRKRIKIIIGLVCGQMKSKFFTESLGNIALKNNQLDGISYRVKNKDKPATQYSFQFINKDKKQVKMAWTSYPSTFWTNRMFTPLACNNCIDTFAYTADIVLMDAWLPEYSQNYLGHTLLIIRRIYLKELFEKYSKNEISLEKISAEKVYKSQEGVVKSKSYFAKNEAKGLMKIIVMLKKRVQILSFTKSYKSLRKYILLIKIIQRINNRLNKKEVK